jgi:hypothetical protein
MGEPCQLKEKSRENTYYLQMMQTILASAISVQYFKRHKISLMSQAQAFKLKLKKWAHV